MKIEYILESLGFPKRVLMNNFSLVNLFVVFTKSGVVKSGEYTGTSCRIT